MTVHIRYQIRCIEYIDRRKPKTAYVLHTHQNIDKLQVFLCISYVLEIAPPTNFISLL